MCIAFIRPLKSRTFNHSTLIFSSCGWNTSRFFIGCLMQALPSLFSLLIDNCHDFMGKILESLPISFSTHLNSVQSLSSDDLFQLSAMARQPSLLYSLTYIRGRRNKFMHFPKVFIRKRTHQTFPEIFTLLSLSRLLITLFLTILQITILGFFFLRVY